MLHMFTTSARRQKWWVVGVSPKSLLFRLVKSYAATIWIASSQLVILRVILLSRNGYGSRLLYPIMFPFLWLVNVIPKMLRIGENHPKNDRNNSEWIDFALGLILVKKYQAESQPEPMDRNSSLLEFRLFSGQFQGNWTQWTIEYGHPWDDVAMSRLLEASNIFEGRKQQNPHGMFVMDREVERSCGCLYSYNKRLAAIEALARGLVTDDWTTWQWWFFTGWLDLQSDQSDHWSPVLVVTPRKKVWCSRLTTTVGRSYHICVYHL